MVREIKWDKNALHQLNEIYEYIGKDSPSQAEKIKTRITQKIEGLTLNPEIHPPDRYKKDNQDGRYRAFSIYHYRVSYYVKEAEIIVIRIRHTAMNPLSY